MSTETCVRCGSHAINQHLHGRDKTRPDLCDVCYWRGKAERRADRLAVLAEQLRILWEDEKND